MALDRPMSAHNGLHARTKCETCTALEEKTMAAARSGNLAAAQMGFGSHDGEHWACYGDRYFDPPTEAVYPHSMEEAHEELGRARLDWAYGEENYRA